MLKVYFGEWADGRLKRLAYLGYYFLLMVLFVAIIFGAIVAVGATEKIMGGDILATQAMLMDHFGLAAMAGFMIFFMAMIVAQVNILAKRIRDMGLPAVWTILGLIAISITLNILFPVQSMEVNTAIVKTAEGTAISTAGTHANTGSMVVQLFDMVVFLCLVFIPSDAFRKNR
ncbi:DUF805 domain-containing protein [Sulfurovum sp. NBC37-1]|uniref:DUF805 domain-containing protein n=1 Tax=Sulfurovum sp. (strain NBC37-1) TaxID=387093 RepID=UPI0001587A93|nr:DUF805 domain-containing protein [Sulfurovum sp. NBC37-1]BAF72746.1 hypothetical protein SUN_1799 [Sulfurovum sp. NBC37-1]